MQTWRAELTAGGKGLEEVNTQSSIFKGDALTLLLFVKAIMPLNQNIRKSTIV